MVSIGMPWVHREGLQHQELWGGAVKRDCAGGDIRADLRKTSRIGQMKEVNESITYAKAQRDREETPCRLRTAEGFQSTGVGE